MRFQMNDLNTLIDDYLLIISRKVSAPYYKTQKIYLSLFKEYLEKYCNSSASNIYLDKFYCYYDSNNRLIKSEPINSSVIEPFFIDYDKKPEYWIRNAKTTLNNFFKSLYMNYNLNSPLEDMEIIFPKRKAKDKYKDVYSRHDILRFINALITTQNDTFIRDLVLYTIWFINGCRPSEILSIKVSDINFDQHNIVLSKTKNKRERLIFLSEMLCEDIKSYCDIYQLSGNGYLFSKNGGLPLTLYDLKKLTQQYFTEAKCNFVSLYAVRHTFATLLFENDVALPTIQQALGHASTNTTKQYIHPNYIRNMGVVNKQNLQLYKKIIPKVDTFIKEYKRNLGD